MSDNVENLILEHLKALRNELRGFRVESREDFASIKQRVNSLERGIAPGPASSGRKDLRRRLPRPRIRWRRPRGPHAPRPSGLGSGRWQPG